MDKTAACREPEPAGKRPQSHEPVPAEDAAQLGADDIPGRMSDRSRHEEGSLLQRDGQVASQQVAEEHPSDEMQHENGQRQHAGAAAAAGGDHCDASSDTDVSMGDGDVEWHVSLSQSPAVPAWRHHSDGACRGAGQPSNDRPTAPEPDEPRASSDQPSDANPGLQPSSQTARPPPPTDGTADDPQDQPAATASGLHRAEAADAAAALAAKLTGDGDAAQRALQRALDAMPLARPAHPNFIILSSSSEEDSDDDQRQGAWGPQPNRTASAAHVARDPRLKPEPSSQTAAQQPRLPPLTPPPMRSPARSDMRAQGWQQQQQAEPDAAAAHAAKRQRVDGGSAAAWRAAHGTGSLWGSEFPLHGPSAVSDDVNTPRGSGVKSDSSSQADRASALPVTADAAGRTAGAAPLPDATAGAANTAASCDAPDVAGQPAAKRTKASVAQSRHNVPVVAEEHIDAALRPKEVQRQKQRARAGAGQAVPAPSVPIPSKSHGKSVASSGAGRRLPGLGAPLDFRERHSKRHTPVGGTQAAAGSSAGKGVAAAAAAPPSREEQQKQQQSQHQQELHRGSHQASAAPGVRSGEPQQSGSHGKIAGPANRLPSGWVPVTNPVADRKPDVSSYIKQRGNMLQRMMREAGRQVNPGNPAPDMPLNTIELDSGHCLYCSRRHLHHVGRRPLHCPTAAALQHLPQPSMPDPIRCQIDH